MRVVQINSVCGSGSTGRIVVDLSRTLTEHGIENHVYYGVGSSNYPLGVRIGNSLNVTMHQLHTRLLGWHGYASRRATMQLIRALNRMSPDVVHLHNVHGFYLNIEMLFRYLAEAGKRVVWTLHDCWSFTGHCAHFDFVGCDRWKTGCYACPQKRSYPVSWLFDRAGLQWARKKRLFASMDKDKMLIVTPSRWLSDLVSQSILGKYEVRVISNGIDLEVFRPVRSTFRRENGLQDNRIILGVSSSWGKRKGLADFIQLEKRLDKRYQIVLVGLTERQRAKLPKSIIGIGRTRDVQQLVQLYSSADVFVNPTLEDNFPTVNLEALSCGIPVVTYDTGGSPESIHGSCGRIVPKGDVNGLADAVERVTASRIPKEVCVRHACEFDKRKKHLEYIDMYMSG